MPDSDEVTRSFCDPIPDSLLAEPLEFIAADHHRQADLCRALQDLADWVGIKTIDPDLIAAIYDSVETDLRLHIQDEEVDLFPRMRVRVMPEDHFMDVLRLLDLEHERDHELATPVRAGLAQLVKGQEPDHLEEFRRAASTLAQSHLSHLNWENAVVLPIARNRLRAEDLDAMGHAMAARRGIEYPGN